MPANSSTRSSVLISSIRPAPTLRTRTSSPGASPAWRMTSAGIVIWFFRETRLTSFTLLPNGKGSVVREPQHGALVLDVDVVEELREVAAVGRAVMDLESGVVAAEDAQRLADAARLTRLEVRDGAADR